ncbi:MAG: cache domain-containing protein [Anaerovibrio sp.]|uniref:methyl-accepting chemotaxis protein n=1 Tax=Anaerovibrio sp. TaxID=1872532 RepID=UPI0025FAAB97|nr:methyl-accepting chemotaxis protein [Anaerovibrio sp.]MCR5176399.1 cache domain-containing protein [Anaerovibrio sp.]
MSLKKQAVLFIDGCLLIACILLGMIAYINADNGFSEAYIGKVSDVAQRLEQLIDIKYPGQWAIKDGSLYKGDTLMEGLSDELDVLAGDEEVTLFKKDIRVSTTVMQDGHRAVGTKANPDIFATVVGQGETANVQANVLGEPYYTCYMPILDSDGNKIGMLFVGAPSEPVKAMERVFLFKMMVAALILFLIVGSISVFIINRKMEAVYAVTDTMDRMAAGDLCIRDISVVGNDELASLAANTNKMKNTMHSLLESIGISASQVASGAKNISDSGNMLANGATTQAASVEQLSASIAEITKQTGQNADHAERANKLTIEANSKAETGNQRMNDMLEAMVDINASSNSIAKIIKVIDEIAFQTNILALNAAVEAARAGQHGKGFAVVAEEVRNLAARSAKAAKETTDIIEESIDKVNMGTKLAQDTSEALKSIKDGVGEVAALVSEIATASVKQNHSLEMLNQGVHQVSNVVQTNSATAEESAAASVQLSAQAEVLQEAISQFKV